MILSGCWLVKCPFLADIVMKSTDMLLFEPTEITRKVGTASPVSKDGSFFRKISFVNIMREGEIMDP